MDETSAFSAQYDLPLVGRDKEWNAVQQIIKASKNGVGSLIFISASSGFGKTRIADEARRYAKALDVKCLSAQGNKEKAGQVYGLFEGIFSDFLAQADDSAQKKIWACIAEYAPHLWSSLFPDREIPRIESNTVDSPQIRQTFFVASITRILSKMAEEQALIIVVDDAHLSDSGSCALLRQLIRKCYAESTFSILLTYDTDEAENSAHSDDFQNIVAQTICNDKVSSFSLKPLDKNGISELINLVADGVEFTSGMLHRVRHITGGNPLHVLQFVEDLNDRGQLKLREQTPLNESSDDSDSRQNSLRKLVTQRLLRLPLKQRTLLGHAAQQGSVFTGRTLALTLKWSAEQVFSSLREILSSTRFLEIKKKKFCFSHTMISELCFKLLSDAERREVHKAIGTALVALHAPPSRIAYHLYEAHEFVDALPYQIAAAKQAGQGFAFGLAHQMIKNAHDVYTNHDVNVTDEVEVELLLTRARYSARVEADWDFALELYRQVVAKGDPSTTVEAMRSTVEIEIKKIIFKASKTAAPDTTNLEEYISTAMNMCSEIGDDASKYRCMSVLGRIYSDIRKDYVAAEDIFLEALGGATDAGDMKNIGGTLNDLAAIHDWQGNREKSWDYLIQSLEALRKMNHKEGVCILLRNMGWQCHFTERFSQADNYFSEALDIAVDIGLPLQIMHLYFSMINNKIESGDIQGALTIFNRAREESAKEITPVMTWTSILFEAKLLIKNKQYEQALEVLTKLQANPERDNDQVDQGSIDFELGEIALAQGEPMRAEKWFLSSYESEFFDDFTIIVVHMKLGQVYRILGKFEEALKYYQKALIAYKNLGLEVKVKRVEQLITDISANHS